MYEESGCAANLFFFFSSRRRHTRFDCDWSSDVCSSDLSTVIGQGIPSMPIIVVTPGVSGAPPSSSVTVSTTNRSEEHTSELQSQSNLVCRLLLEKKKNTHTHII